MTRKIYSGYIKQYLNFLWILKLFKYNYLIIKQFILPLREFEGVEQNANIFEFKRILDYHTETVVNERKIINKLYQQKSPNQLLQENYTRQEVPNKDDLIHMCLRSRNPLKFWKNGIYDSVTDRHYWGDWMPLCTSSSMYLKRDIYSEDDGYLYDGGDKRGFGFAYILKPVSPLCKIPEEREQLRFTMERKKLTFNNVKSFLKNLRNIPIEEQLENYKAVYYKKIAPSNPKILKLVTNSSIEDAVRKVKE